MIQLFICPGCKIRAPQLRTYPYCSSCLNRLNPCPPICSYCLLLYQPSLCDSHPDHRPSHPIDSLWASYITSNESHRILKSWKMKPQLFAESQLFPQRDALIIQNLSQLNLDLIVPIPQSLSRRRELNGGSSFRLATAISQKLSIPLIPLLELKPASSSHRQGQSNLWERQQRGVLFELNYSLWLNLKSHHTKTHHALLVDDLWTSGQTLLSGAKVLKNAGIPLVSGYVLGFKLSDYSQTRTCSSEADACFKSDSSWLF
jgi:predicted amidophosphoribosyltransferase